MKRPEVASWDTLFSICKKYIIKYNIIKLLRCSGRKIGIDALFEASIQSFLRTQNSDTQGREYLRIIFSFLIWTIDFGF